MSRKTDNDVLRRHNHFVPAGFLAAFTSTGRKDGTLWALQRDQASPPFPASVESVAHETDLYVRNVEGNKNDEYERFLANEVESNFYGRRNALAYGGMVGLMPDSFLRDAEHRYAIARFIAFQWLRTPAEREATRWLGHLSSRRHIQTTVLAPESSFLRGLEQHAGRAMRPDDLVRLEDLFHGVIKQAGHIDDWVPRTFRTAERLTAALESMHWDIVRAISGRPFVTGDMPVVWSRQGPTLGSYFLGGGLTEPGVEVVIAVSPTSALYITRDGAEKNMLRDPSFRRSIWQRTVENTQRWVYAAEHDTESLAVLLASRRPRYHVSFAGRSYRVGHDVEEVERAIKHSGVERISFRYGLPDDLDVSTSPTDQEERS